VSIPLHKLATLVQGKVVGDGEVQITSARPLQEARAGDITFLEDADKKQNLQQCQASAVVVRSTVPSMNIPLIQVSDPLLAFIEIALHLKGGDHQPRPGIASEAFVHPTAQIGTDVFIGPGACIGERAVIGDGCQIHPGVVIGAECRLSEGVILYPHVVLYPETVLGNRVIIHANSVIGADGFGYRQKDGKHVKVPQLGRVEIGDDVEIGACTTIDRSTFHATRIGTGTKIDNLVQIGHNCQIGEHNLIVSQVGIAGSSGTGDYVVLAGQVGIVDHVHIGTGGIVGAQSGVTKDVPPGGRVFGSPANPEGQQKRVLMTMMTLPEMRKKLNKMWKYLNLPE